ncbi:calcium/sodium antiporter [Ramlibacter sp. AW1]|uniref:Calcium/sodium antiporter n=1 Tax=Ramlibacter aurantiacus TaxID=2801330 RepID=A0A936ZDQ7_9BURK|nr:calcium/sodium antiporter [Ramlibacter aurantiacus]
MDAFLFAAGLVGLFLGAQLLVRGASALALSMGISPLVVGLTVVAFGTSAPEMAVSVGAALSGTTDLAVGNAVGSNIFNVLFILGAAAVIAPLIVHADVIRREAPILVGGAALLLVLGWDGRITWIEAAVLTLLLFAYTGFLIRHSRQESHDPFAPDAAADVPQPQGGRGRQLLMVAAGLALLVAGSHALVSAAVSFARAFGVSEVVIGLTIVAMGTSLPEVAASLMAAARGQRDIAVGNVVGSCIFNVFGVVGVAGLAAAATGAESLVVPAAIRDFDLWVMLIVFVACVPVFLTGGRIARWEGVLFLLYYAAYTAYLLLAAKRHSGLEAFSDVMLGFVVPLTAVTLTVSVLNRRRPPPRRP